MRDICFLCIGGDERNIYMSEELALTGNVYTYLLSKAAKGTSEILSLDEMTEKADVLVLPMIYDIKDQNGDIIYECSKGMVSFNEIIEKLKCGAVVIGGNPDRRVIEFFSHNGFFIYNYFERKELVIKNCIPTAEGALQLAMENIKTTINESKILVTGYGNVAKAVSKIFSASGAEVTCAVRRVESTVEAECSGYKSIMINELENNISQYDIIINTVPSLIFDEHLLEIMDDDVLMIDLASKPGGIDYDVAEKLNIKAITALGLPGKVAPVTAGRYIAQTVKNLLIERGVLNVTPG